MRVCTSCIQKTCFFTDPLGPWVYVDSLPRHVSLIRSTFSKGSETAGVEHILPIAFCLRNMMDRGPDREKGAAAIGGKVSTSRGFKQPESADVSVLPRLDPPLNCVHSCTPMPAANMLVFLAEHHEQQTIHSRDMLCRPRGQLPRVFQGSRTPEGFCCQGRQRIKPSSAAT